MYSKVIVVLVCALSITSILASSTRHLVNVNFDAKANNRRNLHSYGGQLATTKEYPFGVKVTNQYLRSLDDVHSTTFASKCGGSLISPGVVLTAGHCIEVAVRYYDIMKKEYDVQNDPFQTKSVRVVLDWTEKRERSGEGARYKVTEANSIGVKKMVAPKSGDYGTAELDIGLLFLDTCQHNRTLIKLLESKNQGRVNAFDILPQSIQSNALKLLGFGASDVDECVIQKKGSGSHWVGPDTVPEETKVQTVGINLNRCTAKDNQQNLMMCYNADKQETACHGDSGGPIFFSSNSTGYDNSEANFVQVAVLGGSSVYKEGSLRTFAAPSDGSDNSIKFTSGGWGAFVPSHVQWLKDQIRQSDTCLSDADMTVDDIFVDETIFE